MATPRVESPRRPGCKPGGPSPWRKAYLKAYREAGTTSPANPAYPDPDDDLGSYDGLHCNVAMALEGNTTWVGRQYQMRKDA